MLYAFFWVIPRRLNFICRRFGTPCLSHLHRQVVVKNLLHTFGTFRAWRKFEIKNTGLSYYGFMRIIQTFLEDWGNIRIT